MPNMNDGAIGINIPVKVLFQKAQEELINEQVMRIKEESHRKLIEDMDAITDNMESDGTTSAIIGHYKALATKFEYGNALLYLCKNYQSQFYSLVESLLWYHPFLDFNILTTDEEDATQQYTPLHYAILNNQLSLAFLLFYSDPDSRKLTMPVSEQNTSTTETIEHYLQELIQSVKTDQEDPYHIERYSLLGELKQLPNRVDAQYKDEDIMRLELIIRVFTFIKKQSPKYNGPVPEIFTMLSTLATRELFAKALIAMANLSRPLQAHFLPHLRSEWSLIEQTAGILNMSADDSSAGLSANLFLSFCNRSTRLTNSSTANNSRNILNLVRRRNADQALICAALPDLLKEIDELLILIHAMLRHAKQEPEQQGNNTEESPLLRHGSLCHMRALVTQATTINFLGMLHLIEKTENTTIPLAKLEPPILRRQVSSNLTEFEQYESRLAFLDRLIRIGELATNKNNIPMPWGINRLLVNIRNTLVHVDAEENALKVEVLLSHMSATHYKTLFNELGELYQILLSGINEINMGVEYKGVMSQYWKQLVQARQVLDAEPINQARDQARKRLADLIDAFETTSKSLQIELSALRKEIAALSELPPLVEQSSEDDEKNEQDILSIGLCPMDYETDLNTEMEQKKSKLEGILKSIILNEDDIACLTSISNGLAWDEEKRTEFQKKVDLLKKTHKPLYNVILKRLNNLRNDTPTTPTPKSSKEGLKHLRALGDFLLTSSNIKLKKSEAYSLIIRNLTALKESLTQKEVQMLMIEDTTKLIDTLNSSRLFSACFTQHLNCIALAMQKIQLVLPPVYARVCAIIQQARNAIIHGRPETVLDSCAPVTRNDMYKGLSKANLSKLLGSLGLLFDALQKDHIKTRFPQTASSKTIDLENTLNTLMTKATQERERERDKANKEFFHRLNTLMRSAPPGFFKPAKAAARSFSGEGNNDEKNWAYQQ